jgi:hypothetical protein
MERNLAVTNMAYEALERIQLSEQKRLGYKKPYKIIASEAIMAYSPPSAKPASPQYTVSDIADALLKKHGSKDKAAAAIYSGFPAEFKEQIKSRIMEGGTK